ncbi:hypothetical protein ACW9G8_33045 [Nocardia gipuzkoensis]
MCESDIDFDTGIVTPRGAVRNRDGSAEVWTSMGRRWRRLAAALGLPEGSHPTACANTSAGLDVTKVADQLGNTSRVLRGTPETSNAPGAGPETRSCGT